MLVVREVAISGYRSLRRIGFPVDALSVFVGGNGTGKTNLYRSLELLQAAARGTLTRDLAAEGGMDSALWAGRRRQGEAARIRLSATLRHDTIGQEFVYAVEIGLVQQVGGTTFGAAFRKEPQVKAERLTVRTRGRAAVILDRDGRSGFVRDAEGRKRTLGGDLLPTETALGSLLDATGHPEIAVVRLALAGWRFHHDFRTDAESPLRRPCLAVTTPTLASDGADLAAVFATLAHIRRTRPRSTRPSTAPSRARRSCCRSRAVTRASACASPTSRAGPSILRNCRTAPCATSPWPARCSATGCRRSSR